MQELGPRELMQDVHQRNLCVGCGACVDLCPYFKSHRGRIAMLFPCARTAGRSGKAELPCAGLHRRPGRKTIQLEKQYLTAGGAVV